MNVLIGDFAGPMASQMQRRLRFPGLVIQLDAKHLRGTLNLSLESIRSIPDVPVYIGAATHAMVGAFAGIADIQGIDAYAAACAPTQLAVNKRLPLQYPYYYLRNARDNHAPNTMWGYSQLVHWNW